MMQLCYMSDIPECLLNVWLWRTISIAQLCLGTFGNIMNIIILSRKRFQKYSTSVFLIFLAGADMGTLWAGILPNLSVQGFGRDIRVESQFLCSTLDWLGHVAAAYSIWLLVLLTIERMLLTRYPVFSRSNITRRFSLTVAMLCLFFIACICSHYLFGKEIKLLSSENSNATPYDMSCDPINAEFETFYQTVWPLFILFLFNLLPIFLIVAMNAVILISIIRQRKRVCIENPAKIIQQNNVAKKTKSSTRMIFVISVFFIVTTMPYMINRAFKSQRHRASEKEQVSGILSETVFLLIVYCNFTFNFLLYFMSGTLFHQELKGFIAEIRHKLRRFKLHKKVTSLHGNGTKTTGVIPSVSDGTILTRFR